uniref:Uncharacterized protein n=1 Tax=Rhizophora mucronata TaxID=61149 RepID=A0A2P2NN06_RHIMU
MILINSKLTLKTKNPFELFS